MHIFKAPEIKLVNLSCEDVICTSLDLEEGGSED